MERLLQCKPRIRTKLHFTWFLLLFCGGSALGADKSGVSPNTISLPKGPGSIEGLGESFQPTLNTGTAKYRIGLKLPPGTAGHAPGLALDYEGGGGNGSLGFGWSLGTANIQRRSDKGIPTYGQEVGFPRQDVFINDMKEELVPTTNEYFFSKNESAFIRYQQQSNSWVGTLPNGTRLEFGLTTDGRVEETNASPAHVFCWLLQRETDTHGNTIVYSYTNFAGSQNTNQKYLASISYGPGTPPWHSFHFVSFRYEDRSDWFEDCRSGFVVRTGKRLKEIVIGTQGVALEGHLAGDFNGDGQPDYLVRKYLLGYLNYAGSNSHWSLLGAVTPIGSDGVSALPSSTFAYNVCNPPDSLSAVTSIIEGANEPVSVMDNPSVELVDMNGDGLPDIVQTFELGGTHVAYLNEGSVTRNGQRHIGWQSGQDLGGDPQTQALWLSQTSVHLADMDGDGLADFVVKATSDDVYFFSNKGNVSWGNRQPMTIQDFAPPAPFGQANVRTADLDFDKRIDVVLGDGSEYEIWFNQGGQQYSSRVTVFPSRAFDLALSAVQIADLNGDRLPDIAQIWPDRVEVTAGLGYGAFTEPASIPIPDYTLADTQVQKAKLTDITGDGLADLVLERAAPGELWYWINLGNYTFSNRKVITGMPTGVGVNAVIRWADLNGNGSTDLIYADSTSVPRLQTVDLGELLNCGSLPNILTGITNGIGRITAIGYRPSTQFAAEDAAVGRSWTNVMPNPVTVVASVTNFDSLGNHYVTRFQYHDGYYDSGEKQFRGFARVEQVEVGDATAPTLVTRSYFDTGRDFEAMKGKLLQLTTEQEDGRVFSDDVTSWTIPPITLIMGTNGTNVSYVHPTGHVKMIKELGQGVERRLESEMDYDNFGNQTRNADYGIVTNGTRSAFNEERTTVTQYAINTNLWLIRHRARQEIQDANGAVVSRVDTYYDDETFSGNNNGQVTVGNLTLRQEWISPSNSTALIKATRSKFDQYGNPTLLLDPLALAPNGEVDLSKGHYRYIAYDPDFHTYPVRETIYLGTGREPLVFQAQYDEGFGTVTASFDFNANKTTYGYDAFARLVNIVKPYDTTTYPTMEYAYALAVPVGTGGLVNYIETRQRDQIEIRNPKSEMYLISRQFVDGLGRKLMSKTEAEPAPGSTIPRVVTTEGTLFNARQKPSLVLNPHFSRLPGATLEKLLAFENVQAPGWEGQFEQNGSLVNLGLGAAHATTTAYDATLRETALTNQDGTFRQTIYEPLLTRSLDENQTDPASQYFGAAMVHYNDGLGRLVQVDEVSHLNDDGTTGNSIHAWTTRYQYDLNDQLRFIRDSQDNLKEFRYDGLKRKIFMNDPDRGVMSFVYDDASNLSETTDAKNQRITYTYDGANRILTEDYQDEASPEFSYRRSPDVVYHYDLPVPNLNQGNNTMATATNSKGNLAWVEDASGEEHTSYDARGRTAWTVKRVRDPLHGQLVAYRTAYAYDSLDRVMLMTYPDEDAVSYEYNERGLLKRIPGGPSGSIISNIVYLPSSSMRQIDYGNGVHTTYNYDARLRLKKLLTVSSSINTELINFGYEFDNTSNIRTIADLRPESAVPGGDPRRNTQLFQYDDLYRLTRAQYSFHLPGQSFRNDGEINYRYDRIGNMLSQTSTMNHQENGLPVANLGEMDSGGAVGRVGRVGRAPNDPPGPHALTRVRNNSFPDRNYPYDANGNMKIIDALTNTWDFKDRLVRVENSEMVADYRYDYTDRRITKRVETKNGQPGVPAGPAEATTPPRVVPGKEKLP